MFKFFWSRRQGHQTGTTRDWRHDPSGHPALLQMSTRELADMPMVPELPMRINEARAKAVPGCAERHGNACPA